MRRFSWFSIVLTLAAGCAGSQAARAPQAPSSDAVETAGEELPKLARKQEDHQRRIAELEARLGLLESEARNQRAAAGGARGETIRIATKTVERESGASAASAREGVDEGVDERELENTREPRAARERIPSYRLYGEPLSPAALAGEMPALQVVPLPEDRARALATQPSLPSDPKQEYRAGLRLMREQRYEEALAVFERFITSHPDHALLGNALYWRGEAHYAKRDYAQARDAFEALLARYGGSDKAADSLLKVGLCLRRMGEEAQAKSYFRRVQEKFPKSEAAQIALREGAT
jgi:tol-pal system protein YbgF